MATKTSNKSKSSVANKKKKSLNKASILDKIASVDNSTKKMIEKDNSIVIENEEMKQKKNKKKTQQKKRSHNQVTDFSTYLHMNYNEDSDNELIRQLKDEINRRRITKQFVIDRLMELYGYTEKKASDTSYNMIYTMAKGCEITMKRYYAWIEVLGFINPRLDYEEPDDDLMSSLNFNHDDDDFELDEE